MPVCEPSGSRRNPVPNRQAKTPVSMGFRTHRYNPVMISSFVRSRGRMERAEAEALYEFDWISRKVIEQMGNDATREWVTFTHKTNHKQAEKLPLRI